MQEKKKSARGKRIRRAGMLAAFLVSAFLMAAAPAGVRAGSGPDTENGTIVFTEKAVGGGPYSINIRLTKTISRDEEPYIVLTNENNYSGSLSVRAGRYTVRATVVERVAPEDVVASVVNAMVYVTPGLEQAMTVYVGTVEDLKAAGAYLEEGDSGYGKTVKEAGDTGRKGDVYGKDTALLTGGEVQDPKVDYEELPETEKGFPEKIWAFRYLAGSILVIALAVFGVPKFVRRNREEDDDDMVIWKD